MKENLVIYATLQRLTRHFYTQVGLQNFEDFSWAVIACILSNILGICAGDISDPRSNDPAVRMQLQYSG